MRYILIVLVGISWGLPLAAQEFPGGKSLEPKSVPFKSVEEDLSLDDSANSTNKTDHTTIGFLMSTGVEYADEGEYEEAERAYLRALKEAPDSPDIRFRLSTLYINMERYSEAIGLLQGLLEEYPENAMMHNNLSWCYATGKGVKDKKKSLRHAREAILSAPNTASVWNTLAEAYYVAGDYDKALRSAEHALDLLIQTNPTEDVVKSFMAQRDRIRLSKKALRMFQGLDDDD